MRVTNQLVIIQESVLKYKGHAAIEEVFKRAKRRLPQLSLATVYRNLSRLVAELKIGRVFVSGTALYEANLSPHLHFGCRKCGVIEDIQIDKRTHPIYEVIEGHGVSVTEFNFVALGTCKKCSERGQKR